MSGAWFGNRREDPPMPICDSPSNAHVAFAFAPARIHASVVARPGRFEVSLIVPNRCVWFPYDRPRAAVG